MAGRREKYQMSGKIIPLKRPALMKQTSSSVVVAERCLSHILEHKEPRAGTSIAWQMLPVTKLRRNTSTFKHRDKLNDCLQSKTMTQGREVNQEIQTSVMISTCTLELHAAPAQGCAEMSCQCAAPCRSKWLKVRL